MKKLKLTIALLMVISFIAILFATNVYATDTTATTGTSTEKVYSYEITGNFYQSESTHWHMWVPEGGASISTYVWIKENGETVPSNKVTDEMRVTSSDETILKIKENNEIITLKAGEVDLIQCGKTVGKVTVYADSEAWGASYDEFTGVPVIVINDNVNNYIESRNQAVTLSTINPPKLEIKLLKDGKIMDLDPLWTPTVETTDIISIENGIITPKKNGIGKLEIRYYGDTEKWLDYQIHLDNTDVSNSEIAARGEKAITVTTESGKEIIVEKNTFAYFGHYLKDGGFIPVYDDVYIQSSDESIEGLDDNMLKSEKVGTTSIVVERTGKAAETIKVRVVESFYQYKAENPELFPEDFEIVEEDIVPKGENYEKLNTEALDSADTLHVDLKDYKSIVKSDVFKSFKEYKDRELRFVTYRENDYISWTFDSNNIKNTDVDFMPGIEISTERFDNIKTDEVEDGIFIKFLHDGYLPGKAEVYIFSNEVAQKYGDTQKTLNLYYYNPETNDYENAGTVEYNLGSLRFSIEHCSDYAVTEVELEGKKDKVVAKLDDEPKAGDESIVIFATFAAITTLGGIVLLTKKD